MKNLRKNKTVKYAILSFAFVFIVTGAFSSIRAQFTDPNSVFFPNDQTVTSPNFFPFSNSQGVIDVFNQNGCQDPGFLFDGPTSLSGLSIEIGPAGNGFETGNRSSLIFDPNGNVFFDGTGFPTINPNTMIAFDPSMGDILGLSIVPGTGFPSSATFMITTTFNCDNGVSSTSSTTSSSSTSSSGGSVSTTSSSGGSSSGLTDVALIDRAISSERSAKSFINVKDLINGMDSSFSVSMALDALMSSDSDLKELQDRFRDNNIMIGMSSIQTKLGDAIDNDSEASMILDPLKNTPPSPSDGELTTGVTKAKRLINEAINSKTAIKRKLAKIEKSEK